MGSILKHGFFGSLILFFATGVAPPPSVAIHEKLIAETIDSLRVSKSSFRGVHIVTHHMSKLTFTTICGEMISSDPIRAGDGWRHFMGNEGEEGGITRTSGNKPCGNAESVWDNYDLADRFNEAMRAATGKAAIRISAEPKPFIVYGARACPEKVMRRIVEHPAFCIRRPEADLYRMNSAPTVQEIAIARAAYDAKIKSKLGSTASSNDQFDLNCKGTATSRGPNVQALIEPFETNIRLDLRAKRWCAGQCETIHPVLAISDSSITLSPRGGDGLWRHSETIVNRLTGTYSREATSEGDRASWNATCVKTSFTPFPTAKF